MRKFEVKFNFSEEIQLVKIPFGMEFDKSSVVLQALRQFNDPYPRNYKVEIYRELTPEPEVTVSGRKTATDEKREAHVETIAVGIQGLFEEGMKVNEVLSTVSSIVMSIFSDRLEKVLKDFKGI